MKDISNSFVESQTSQTGITIYVRAWKLESRKYIIRENELPLLPDLKYSI